MSTDDTRMHGGDTPGLVPARGNERHEDPVPLYRPEPGAPASPPRDGPAQDMVRDLDRGDPTSATAEGAAS